jgi:hypothetical protein
MDGYEHRKSSNGILITEFTPNTHLTIHARLLGTEWAAIWENSDRWNPRYFDDGLISTKPINNMECSWAGIDFFVEDNQAWYEFSEKSEVPKNKGAIESCLKTIIPQVVASLENEEHRISSLEPKSVDSRSILEIIL